MPTNSDRRNMDRRQTPRVRCSGIAKIVALPSEGIVVPGRVRNLSLGGCGIETAVPLAPGARTEILLRVKASSIRVVGEVQAQRRPDEMGVEFVLFSSSGKDLLAELIEELERQKVIAAIAHAARHQSDCIAIHKQTALLSGSRSIRAGLVGVEPTVQIIENTKSQATASTLATPPAILDVAELDLFI